MGQCVPLYLGNPLLELADLLVSAVDLFGVVHDILGMLSVEGLPDCLL